MIAPLRILSRLTCLMPLLVLCAAAMAGGQEDEMKMIERVAPIDHRID